MVRWYWNSSTASSSLTQPGQFKKKKLWLVLGLGQDGRPSDVGELRHWGDKEQGGMHGLEPEAELGLGPAKKQMQLQHSQLSA